MKADALRAAWTQYRRTGRTAVRAPLFMTLQLELWLRARLRGGAATPRLVTPEEVLATAS